MNHLPDFLVQNPPLADPQMPPPYRFDDAAVQLFQVYANADRLRSVCDRMLNDVARQCGSAFRVTPLALGNLGIVNIQIIQYPKVYSLAPGYKQFGYSTQNELFFAIPVLETKWSIPRAVGMFIPFLWVDNALSVVSGRDVMGYPKVQASFTLPSDISRADGSRVTSLATQRLSPDDPVRSQTLFETEVDSTAPLLPDDTGLLDAQIDGGLPGQLRDDVARPLWPFGHLDDLYAADRPLETSPQVQALLRDSAGGLMKSYMLKQFRDPQHLGKACYQGIIEADTDMRDFRKGGFLPSTRIRVPKYASLDIIEQLGLHATNHTIMPRSGFWYHASFGLDRATNVATQTGHPPGPNIPGPAPTPGNCIELCALGAREMLHLQQRLAHRWLRVLNTFDKRNGRA